MVDVVGELPGLEVVYTPRWRPRWSDGQVGDEPLGPVLAQYGHAVAGLVTQFDHLAPKPSTRAAYCANSFRSKPQALGAQRG